MNAVWRDLPPVKDAVANSDPDFRDRVLDAMGGSHDNVVGDQGARADIGGRVSLNHLDVDSEGKLSQLSGVTVVHPTALCAVALLQPMLFAQDQVWVPHTVVNKSSSWQGLQKSICKRAMFYD